jgi:RNA polymerase sigma factor (sigma-70 family)
MDQLLLPYLQARDESERQQLLDELLKVHAAPVVRETLRRKLGFYVSAQGINPRNQDAEDAYQESMTRVLQLLHDLGASSPKTEIDSFEHYVGRIATNICVDFLRAKSPVRTRLKDSFRDLFHRHKDLVSWEYEDEILCGFAVWRNTNKTLLSNQRASDMEIELQTFQAARFAHEDVRTVPLPRVVAKIFDWIGGPVEIDTLVRIMATLFDVKDRPIESLDDDTKPLLETRFAASALRSDSALQAKELRSRLWQVVKRLPPEQRDAFSFTFEDDDGEDLFTVLLSSGIVTLLELARVFGRSVEQIILLAERMPMDTPTVVAELNTSRENVYKWRFRAIQRLEAELLPPRKKK